MNREGTAKGTIETDKEDSNCPPELHQFGNSLGSTSAGDKAEGKGSVKRPHVFLPGAHGMQGR